MIVADARRLPYADASVHAIVTDPPYGLEFMGKEWDKLDSLPGRRGQNDRDAANRGMNAGALIKAPGFDHSAEAKRAAQEWHLEWAREALRVAKPGAHLVAFGGTRTHHRLMCALEDAGWEIRDCLMWLYGSGFPKSLDVSKAIDKAAGAEREETGRVLSTTGNRVNGSNALAKSGLGAVNVGPQEHRETAPATEDAKRWEGWGTALKPAWEPIALARKPLSGTVAKNVLEHGTGGLNIDGCRVPRPGQPGWPANVVHDGSEEVLAGFPGSGSSRVRIERGNSRADESQYRIKPTPGTIKDFGDSGSAARFFYCAKASTSERGEGNDHPTVKPLALMEWLVKLVTPPGGTVLDPFSGSGTTEMACRNLGFRYLGGDNSLPHLLIQHRRLADHRAVASGEALPPRKMGAIDGPLFAGQA